MADLTGRALHLAWKYRMPAMLLADGTMGQMMEPVKLPEPCNAFGDDNPWAATGTEMKRPHNIITSLDLSPENLEKQNFERFERYKKIEESEPLWEEYMMDDAEICIVACGITARVSRNAIVEARKQGIKVGMLRPITLWPFPKKALAAAAEKVSAFLCVEMNMGQMKEDVELAIRCRKPVALCNRVGGMIPTPDEVLAHIKKIAEGGIEA
jgi:2-oxoglutarate ferredoxin oxidoreductase subunit alpha